MPDQPPWLCELLVHGVTGRVLVDRGDSQTELADDEPGEWAPCVPPA